MKRPQPMSGVSLKSGTNRDGRGETPVTPCDLSTYLERARVRLGVQIKEIAIDWDTDHGYVSRCLSNKDPLPDYRFTQLSRQLQIATLEEWARDLGVTTGRKADLTRALESLAQLAADDAGHATVPPFRRIASRVRSVFSPFTGRPRLRMAQMFHRHEYALRIEPRRLFVQCWCGDESEGGLAIE